MIIIRQIKSEDFDKWRGVYHYYALHYEVTLKACTVALYSSLLQL